MEHFYNKIEGWFDFPELYSAAVQGAGDGAHFVEIGAWYGKSTSYMAVEIANSGKIIRFDAVDTWAGSEEHTTGGRAEDKNIVHSGTIYQKFLDNLAPAAYYVTPIRKPSVEASQLYKDNSLDFVLLDAAHDYENVTADINAWFPKVKHGGIIAGHDFTGDWPGVVKAVFESPLLDSNNVRTVKYCWVYQKPAKPIPTFAGTIQNNSSLFSS